VRIRSKSNRDRKIYRDFNGLNDDQIRVPAIVLARRYSLTRARVYQIISRQSQKQKLSNPRIAALAEDSTADANKIADMLRHTLEL